MLSLLFLGVFAAAFAISLVGVLVLGLVGWGMICWLRKPAAAIMTGAHLVAAGAIVYMMVTVISDAPPGQYNDTGKMTAWAMSPALFLAVLFAALCWRSYRKSTAF